MIYAIPYLGLAVFCLVYYAWWTGLTWESLSFVNYGAGDLTAILAIAKEIITGQWPLFSVMQSDHLGAPFGMVGGDYPLFDWLHYATFYFFGLFTKEPAIVINLFWLISFPLIACAMLFALQRILRVQKGIALILAFTYAFLPFRYVRFEHIFLANYFLVPIFGAICVRVAMDEQPFSKKFFRFCVLASALAGANGVYYAYFYLVFLGIASLISLLQRRPTWRLTAILAAITIGSGALCSAPYVVYKIKHGKNPYTSERQSIESDIYGLKMANILLPSASHLVPLWGKLRSKQHATPDVEGKIEYITIFGILGLILGFLALFDVSGRRVSLRPLKTPGLFLLFGIFFAMPGGFASLIANYITPQFRAPNRISVYLAFFAFLAVGWAMQAWIKPGPRRKWILSGMFLFALVDVSMPHVRKFHTLQTFWPQHRAFFRELDAQLPADTMIYQIPYMEYPETLPIQMMGDYTPMIPYIHSEHLRWSYGVIKRGPTDRSMRFVWQVFESDPLAAIPLLAAYGYRGILMDRFGFADHGENLVNRLTSVFSAPRTSGDDRFAFFDISGGAPPSVPHTFGAFTQGFYDFDRDGDWIGANKEGKIEFFNSGTKTQEITLPYDVQSPLGGELKWSSKQIDTVPAGLKFTADEKIAWRPKVRIPPGYSSLEFQFTGEVYRKRHDWRRIGFKLVKVSPAPLPNPSTVTMIETFSP